MTDYYKFCQSVCDIHKNQYISTTSKRTSMKLQPYYPFHVLILGMYRVFAFVFDRITAELDYLFE